MIWIGFFLAVAFVLVILLWPFFRSGDSAAADALAVYRDAMAAAQTDEERAEIEARVLAAAAADTTGAYKPLSKGALGAVAAFVIFVMLGGGFTLYAMIGVPQLDGRPIASVARPTAPAGQSIAGEDAGPLAELAGQLHDKLREQGEDAPAEGWMLLARTYLQLGRHADAADAFEQAATRAPGDPEPLMGAGEDEVVHALRQNTAFLQREVAQRLGLKFAPKLKFRKDESFAEADRIEALLRDPKVARDLSDDPDEGAREEI